MWKLHYLTTLSVQLFVVSNTLLLPIGITLAFTPVQYHTIHTIPSNAYQRSRHIAIARIHLHSNANNFDTNAFNQNEVRFVQDVDPAIQLSSSVSYVSGVSTQPNILSNIDKSYLKAPMEHTQSLWGPPDPYLAAGKSIVPTTTSRTVTQIDPDRLPFPTISGESLWPNLSPRILRGNAPILDANDLTAQPLLPGFSPTGGILSTRGITPDPSTTFAAQVEWSASFLNVVDHLPEAVFYYALVEFFLLRPSIDRYTEDVEEESGRALTETVAVTSVRIVMFVLVAAVTTIIYG